MARALLPAQDPDTAKTIALIASRIRAGAGSGTLSTLGRLDAVHNYLISTCYYSLQSPVVPPDQDSTVYFLTRSHQGACDMFASSMALLLRCLGVPARVATGYLQPDAEDGSAVGAKDRTFLVKESDAHAWVEYFEPGLGWVAIILPWIPECWIPRFRKLRTMVSLAVVSACHWLDVVARSGTGIVDLWFGLDSLGTTGRW